MSPGYLTLPALIRIGAMLVSDLHVSLAQPVITFRIYDILDAGSISLNRTLYPYSLTPRIKGPHPGSRTHEFLLILINVSHSFSDVCFGRNTLLYWESFN